MNVKVLLRKSDGATWFSDTQRNPKELVLRPCLENVHLTPADAQTVQFLIDNDVVGMMLVTDPKAKLVIKLNGFSVSVPLDVPTRKITATAISKITDAIAMGIISVKEADTGVHGCGVREIRPVKDVPLREKVLDELKLYGYSSPPESLVDTCITSMCVRGTLPVEVTKCGKVRDAK